MAAKNGERGRTAQPVCIGKLEFQELIAEFPGARASRARCSSRAERADRAQRRQRVAVSCFLAGRIVVTVIADLVEQGFSTHREAREARPIEESSLDL